MTNGQTPEERGVYETLRYTFSYAPEEEEEEVIFSRSIHSRREIFRVQGNNKRNRPFFLFFLDVPRLPPLSQKPNDPQ